MFGHTASSFSRFPSEQRQATILWTVIMIDTFATAYTVRQWTSIQFRNTNLIITRKTGNFLNKCHVSGESRCLSFENELGKRLFEVYKRAVCGVTVAHQADPNHTLCGEVCLRNLVSKVGRNRHKIQDSPVCQPYCLINVCIKYWKGGKS
jgi:hypothetical protein